ncbi:MAG: 16S rRNA (adenine(1518)-N(6)/adenine(1519)-N(6))-dimethyltransferase RsmA [Methyloligellaceae bacterium]
MTPDGLPPLRDVIRGLGLAARKSLGQNFLLDLNLTRRIARAAGPLAGQTVIEIGPGPGGLTRALLMEGADKVIVIERDERCRPALDAIGEHFTGRVDIMTDDALTVDYQAIANERTQIVANLPYNIGTPLLVLWLKAEPWPPWYKKLTLMFQKEVAERIVAKSGTKSYGRLSVLANWRTETDIRLKLPARAFTPPPKVDSALVEFVPRHAPLSGFTTATLERMTSAAFGQRRKMLRQSLKQITKDPAALLEAAGLEPSHRAEQVDIDGFCNLARLLEQHERENLPHSASGFAE